jgi:hypothetical protein
MKAKTDLIKSIHMKLKLIVCIVIMAGLAYCKKDNTLNYKSTGKIFGPDYRMCACCGGYFIAIDSLTYNFDSIPSNSNIDLRKDTFPISVKLDWQLKSTGCSKNWITIQRISRK